MMLTKDNVTVSTPNINNNKKWQQQQQNTYNNFAVYRDQLPHNLETAQKLCLFYHKDHQGTNQKPVAHH